MILRTVLRVILNSVFVNNVFIRVLANCVKFYYDLFKNTPQTLKFKKSLPIKYSDTKSSTFFLSITGDKVDRMVKTC